MRHYDEILELIGPYGRYQQIVVYAYAIPASFYAPVIMYVLTFVGLEPVHYCKLPNTILYSRVFQENSTEVLHNLIPTTLEYGQKKLASCQQYDLTDVNWTVYDHNITTISDYASEIPCKFGWHYETQGWVINYVEKWKLTCDRRIYWTIIVMCHHGGGALGSLVLGTVTGRIGRRPVILGMYVWYFIFGIVLLLSQTWEVFAVLAFIRAMAVPGAWVFPYIYVQEFVGTSHRGYVCTLLVVAYACGSAVLAALCYISNNSKTIISIASAPAMMILLYAPLLQESPRWLLATGRVTKAKEVLSSMVSVNDCGVTSQRIDHFIDQVILSNHKEHGGVNKPSTWSPFIHGKNLAIKLLITCILFTTVITITIGLNFNIRVKDTNPYLAFGLSALVEIPAGFMVPVSNWIGRVRLGSISLCITFIATVITAMVPVTKTWLVILMAILAKFSITIAYNLAELLAVELFPTKVRATSMGIASFIAGIGTIVVPYIVHGPRGSSNPSIMIFFAVLSLMSAVLILLLPETASVSLVDSFATEKTRLIGWNSFLKNLLIRRETPA